jgi:general secretion pathway protein G
MKIQIRNPKLEIRNPNQAAAAVLSFRRTGGFTLVEMLLVLVILATLAAIVYPKLAGRSEQARETAAKTQISSFSTALDAFEVDNGYYPRGKNGLQDLVQQPSDAPNWRQQYMKEIPLDPWGNAYVYEAPGRNNVNGYDLASPGPDGKAGSEDDITNWTRN